MNLHPRYNDVMEISYLELVSGIHSPGKFLMYCIQQLWNVHPQTQHQNLIVMSKSYFDELIENKK